MALFRYNDGIVRVWDAGSGKELRSFPLKKRPARVDSARFSRDGARVLTVSSDKKARIWEARSGDLVSTIDTLLEAPFPDPLTEPVSTFAVVSPGGAFQLWDVDTGRRETVLPLNEHAGRVSAVGFSPDGGRIVTGSGDQTARIWDVSTGGAIMALTGHAGDVRSAQFSHDGNRVVTASWDSTVRTWEAATGKELGTLRGHTGRVHAAHFSIEGKHVVSVGSDRTARIWDSATGEEIWKYDWHQEDVRSLSFSPDGREFVTTSLDQTVRRWPIDPLEWAEMRKPRELTPDEVDRFLIGTPRERGAYRQRWNLRRLIRMRAIQDKERAPDARGLVVYQGNLSSALRSHVESDTASSIQDKTCAVILLAADRIDTKGGDPELLEALGECLRARGALREAILAMECAVKLDEASPSLQARLDEYREAALPDLPTCGSIDAAMDAREPLIAKGATWRLLRGTAEPSTEPLAWTHLDFDHRHWVQGTSGFGYEDGDDATVLDDMKERYTSVYVRHAFSISDPSQFERFFLCVRADDGFVAYLNGREVFRVRAGDDGRPLRFDSVATAAAPEPLRWDERLLSRDLFRSGENILAIQGLNQSPSSSDFSLIPVLTASLAPDSKMGRQRFEEYRAVLKGTDAPARLAYLEGRRLQRMGKHEEAARRFEEALEKDGEQPEIYLRLAESLREIGKPEAAEAQIRRAEDLGILRSEPRGP